LLIVLNIWYALHNLIYSTLLYMGLHDSEFDSRCVTNLGLWCHSFSWNWILSKIGHILRQMYCSLFSLTIKVPIVTQIHLLVLESLSLTTYLLQHIIFRLLSNDFISMPAIRKLEASLPSLDTSNIGTYYIPVKNTLLYSKCVFQFCIFQSQPCLLLSSL
jgi:hypothetical protein